MSTGTEANYRGRSGYSCTRYVDACEKNEPKNPAFYRFSDEHKAFKFTYRGECYKSEAFCEVGDVARFEYGPKNSSVPEPFL